MFSTSTSRAFSTVPQNDSQSIQHATNDISLNHWPTKGHSKSISVHQGYLDGKQSFDDNVPADPAFAPITRPRRSHTTALPWRSPCSLRMIIFIGDVILTIAPCIFLVLAFEALKLNHQPISKHGEIVEQAAKLGPTLYPIIFAAIVGRFMRCYALWRAECGSTLGLLEQLNGSQNLLAAFERAIVLPGLGLSSFGVVLLWALSPVGGQSSLRVLSRGQDGVLGNVTLYYTNVTGYGDAFSGGDYYDTYGSSLNAVFQALMTSLQLVNGSDIWGNIKIPVLENIDSFKAGKEEEGWYYFNETNYKDPYSALNGIVVSGLQENKVTNYSMESSYFNMSCTDPVFFNMTDEFAMWVGNLSERGTNASLLFNGLYDDDEWNSYMIDTNYHYHESDLQTSKQVYNYVYASMAAGDERIAAYNCTLGLSYLESQISCNGHACHVQRVRPSQIAPSHMSASSFLFSDGLTYPYYLLYWMSRATTLSHSAYTSPIDFYISGSDSPFTVGETSNNGSFTSVSYTNVTGADLAKRFQSIVNTGWQLSIQGAATAQPPPNITPGKITVDTGSASYAISSTLATTIENHEVFVANLVWVAVTMILACILLFCGIAGLYFRYRSRSPDILGYVSSMTRDNTNFEAIPGGDKLGGLERARVMRHVRVQIADVKPWDGQGHITLKPLEDRSQE